jgi:transposase
MAIHSRSSAPGRYSTLTEHMPEKHQKVGEWNAERLTRWAAEIGPQTAALVQAILASRQHPEQAFRSCLGILRLGGKYAHDQLELACQIARNAQTLNYRGLKAVLDTLPPLSLSETNPLPAHENIRGNAYYQ